MLALRPCIRRSSSDGLPEQVVYPWCGCTTDISVLHVPVTFIDFQILGQKLNFNIIILHSERVMNHLVGNKLGALGSRWN